jgi:hypothetical protein
MSNPWLNEYKSTAATNYFLNILSICQLPDVLINEYTIFDFRFWQLNDHRAMISIMVFNATFNNISAISWRSVLLVGETGVLGENQRPVTSH